MNLPRANAVLAVGNHPHRGEPFVESDRRILEDSPHLDRELTLLMPSLALPHAAGGNEGNFLRATDRADNAIRPAPCHKVIQAVICIREVLNSLLECLGFVFHAPRLTEGL